MSRYGQVAGEVEPDTAVQLEQVLQRIGLASAWEKVLIDATNLEFIDIRGLLTLDRHAAANAIILVLRSPPTAVTRLLNGRRPDRGARGGRAMRPRSAEQSGFLHELVLHSSLEELLEFILPFIRDGVAAEEPTLLLVRPETAATVVHRVERSPHLLLLPALGQPGRPAADLRATETLLAGYGPGTQVRIVNQEPVVPEAQWHEWRRLEAVVSLALRRHNAWAVCVYDRRPLTDEMVDDLYATHHMTGQGDHHRRNDRYQDPVEFISKHQDAPPDPVERDTPSAELVDPSPATARAAVAGFARQTNLRAQEIENIVLAAHEAVSNAILHGRPPVVLRLWVRPAGFTVTVTDTGPGPTDPFVGLLPPEHSNGTGLGLWISHQLVDITHRRHPDGYTVRLAMAGLPLNLSR